MYILDHVEDFLLGLVSHLLLNRQHVLEAIDLVVDLLYQAVLRVFPILTLGFQGVAQFAHLQVDALQELVGLVLVLIVVLLQPSVQAVEAFFDLLEQLQFDPPLICFFFF